MKFKKLIGGLLLSTVLAAGIGVSLAPNKQAIEARADGTIDIYCTMSRDDINTDYIGVYQWGGKTPAPSWGTFAAMSVAYTNSYSQDVFKLSIPYDRTGIIFVVYQGSNLKQTVNIESGIGNNKGWYFSGWTGDGKLTVGGPIDISPYTINYLGNGSTSGSMSSQTAYADVDWGLTPNAFSRTGYSFAGWNTKADGSGDPYDNQALIESGTMSAGEELNLYAQWNRVYSAGRYAVGDFDGCNWGIEGAVELPNTGSQYEGQITLSFGDEFKIYYYNGSSLSSDFGYSSVLESCGAYHYFSSGTNGNIKCYARGTYNLYFTDSEYATGKKISIELSGSKNAEHLAALLMGADTSSGTCRDNDKFPAMRSIYLNELSDGEKTVFQGYASSSEDQFKNAYLRYTAWAKALGENPWANAKANQLTTLIGITSESASTTIIIVVVAVVSVAAVGGYFLFKKKKN